MKSVRREVRKNKAITTDVGDPSGAERTNLPGFILRNDQQFLGCRNTEFLLPGKPGVEEQRIVVRIMYCNVTHGDAARPLLVPATYVGAAAGPGDNDCDAVQLVVTGMEDVTCHAQ
jgi:hypothetical protein